MRERERERISYRRGGKEEKREEGGGGENRGQRFRRGRARCVVDSRLVPTLAAAAVEKQKSPRPLAALNYNYNYYCVVSV